MKNKRTWRVTGRPHNKPIPDYVKVYTNEAMAHRAARYAAATDKTRTWTVSM